jgi:hypothetical protein
MHTSEGIHKKAELSRFRNGSLQSAFRGSFTRVAPGKDETLGRLQGSTLTERVMRYLERYEKAVHGFR